MRSSFGFDFVPETVASEKQTVKTLKLLKPLNRGKWVLRPDRGVREMFIMKLRNIACSMVGSVLVVALFVGCASEKGEKEEAAKLEAQAKVSRVDAEKTALARVPNGTIKEGEIEKEKGKLIWSFDIATPGTKDITEVNVDAMTGEVVGVEKETAKEEAKEKR